MLLYVDPHSGVPIFRQLMDQVKLHIAAGDLKPGDELPSVRSLSVPLGVNPMTISKAYNLLVREDVLERRPGKSLVVADVAQEDMIRQRIDQLRRSLRPAVKLVNDLGVDPETAVTLYRDMLTGAETGDDRKDEG